eukprot:378323_1
MSWYHRQKNNKPKHTNGMQTHISVQVQAQDVAVRQVLKISTNERVLLKIAMPLLMSWYELYAACPACNNDWTPSKWTHSSCGKRTMVSDTAYIGCKGEHYRKVKFVNNYWKCSYHSEEARKTNKMFVATGAMKAAMAIMTGAQSGKCTNAYAKAFPKIMHAIAEQLES